MLTIPTIAMATDVDIEPGANATCDNGTLKTTEGDVNLRAEWEPHTITLNYYNGDTQYDSNSCTYGGGITLPSQPSRDGYTFQGWRLVQSQQQQSCLISNYPSDDYGIDYGYINDSTGQYGSDSYNYEQYTLTEDNTWAVEFNNGIIKGRALCGGLSGDNHDWEWGGNSSDWTATESAILSAPGEKKYCWCAGTSFGDQCSVSSPSWVFSYVYDLAFNCAYYCAAYCANHVNYGSAFRRAIFLGQ